MYRKSIALVLLVCFLLCGCGSNGVTHLDMGTDSNKPDVSEQETEEIVEVKNAPVTEWKFNQIELPDANGALGDLVPSDCDVITQVWGVANEAVYRFVEIGVVTMNIQEEKDTVRYCVQMLTPPYNEWKNYPVEQGDWISSSDSELCGTEYVCISEEGSVYALFSASDGEYIGRWSRNGGYSATKMENDLLNQEWLDERITLDWIAGDEVGYYFSCTDRNYTTYSSLWLAHDGSIKENMIKPEEGYVWNVTMNPYSGTTYFCGMDSQGVSFENDTMSVYSHGFSVWSEETGEMIFNTQDAGMFYGMDRVVFCSETEGFLCSMNGLWHFSLEDKSIKNLLSTPMRASNKTEWHGVYARDDGSLLMLSKGIASSYGENAYFLWELREEFIDF